MTSHLDSAKPNTHSNPWSSYEHTDNPSAQHRPFGQADRNLSKHELHPRSGACSLRRDEVAHRSVGTHAHCIRTGVVVRLPLGGLPQASLVRGHVHRRRRTRRCAHTGARRGGYRPRTVCRWRLRLHGLHRMRGGGARRYDGPQWLLATGPRDPPRARPTGLARSGDLHALQLAQAPVVHRTSRPRVAVELVAHGCSVPGEHDVLWHPCAVTSPLYLCYV